MSKHLPPSVRVFFAGTTGSGKSWLLQKVFLPRFRRALIVDPMGDYSALKPSRGPRFLTRTIGETFDALKAAPRKGSDWWVVAQLGAREARALAPLIAPADFNSPPPFGLAVGGFAFACEEVHGFASNPSPEEIERCWSGGRHAGVTILAATQRPAQVSRVVTAMSRYLLLCATHEPDDLVYYRKLIGSAGMEQFDQLTEHGAIVFETFVRRGYRIDKDHKIVARF